MRWPTSRNLRFVGSATTSQLLQTPLFWKALGNTLYFVVVGVPLSIARVARRGAAAAFAGWRGSRPFFRTALFAPVVTTLVAVAVIWRYLFHTALRPAQLRRSAGSGSHPIDWLGDPHWAMPAIILFAVWKNFGYNMVIFLAGLQSIPATCTRRRASTARRRWQQFRHVTLPMLAPDVCWSAS